MKHIPDTFSNVYQLQNLVCKHWLWQIALWWGRFCSNFHHSIYKPRNFFILQYKFTKFGIWLKAPCLCPDLWCTNTRSLVYFPMAVVPLYRHWIRGTEWSDLVAVQARYQETLDDHWHSPDLETWGTTWICPTGRSIAEVSKTTRPLSKMSVQWVEQGQKASALSLRPISFSCN